MVPTSTGGLGGAETGTDLLLGKSVRLTPTCSFRSASLGQVDSGFPLAFVHTFLVPNDPSDTIARRAEGSAENIAADVKVPKELDLADPEQRRQFMEGKL
jgi:hypothetical protein